MFGLIMFLWMWRLVGGEVNCVERIRKTDGELVLKNRIAQVSEIMSSVLVYQHDSSQP